MVQPSATLKRQTSDRGGRVGLWAAYEVDVEVLMVSWMTMAELVLPAAPVGRLGEVTLRLREP